jgi:hypothetical protein
MKGRRAWSSEHPVHAAVVTSFLGSFLMFGWMWADSGGRLFLPLIFVPIDLALVFLGVLVGLFLEQRSKRKKGR